MAYIYAIKPGHFLGQVVWSFPNMVTIGAGTAYCPVKPVLYGAVLKDTFSQWTAANITQAYH